MCKLEFNNIGSLNLSNRPETYRTIMKEGYGKNSLASSIRRKISKLIKYGFICSKPIKKSSKEYGKELIFYTMDKEYFIIYTKKFVYYCDNINTLEKSVELINSFKLKNYDWIKCGTKEINISEVIICF